MHEVGGSNGEGHLHVDTIEMATKGGAGQPEANEENYLNVLERALISIHPSATVPTGPSCSLALTPRREARAWIPVAARAMKRVEVAVQRGNLALTSCREACAWNPVAAWRTLATVDRGSLALTSRLEARACIPVAATATPLEEAEIMRGSLALTSCREARA